MLCSLRKAMRARKSLQGAGTIVRPGNKGNNRRIHFFQFLWGISAQSDIINVIECRDEYRTNTGEQPGKSLQKGVLPC